MRRAEKNSEIAIGRTIGLSLAMLLRACIKTFYLSGCLLSWITRELTIMHVRSVGAEKSLLFEAAIQTRPLFQIEETSMQNPNPKLSPCEQCLSLCGVKRNNNSVASESNCETKQNRREHRSVNVNKGTQKPFFSPVFEHA